MNSRKRPNPKLGTKKNEAVTEGRNLKADNFDCKAENRYLIDYKAVVIILHSFNLLRTLKFILLGYIKLIISKPYFYLNIKILGLMVQPSGHFFCLRVIYLFGHLDSA